MTLTQYFDSEIKPLADELGRSLGIKTIDVREVHSTDEVEVKRYVKVLNPFDEVLFMTEDEVNRYTALGLAIRRVI